MTATPTEPPSGRVILVRHGETEWSRSGQHTGTTDLPLLPEGEDAAGRLAHVLTAYDIAHVRSSPLLRARHTAELAGLRCDELDEDLREWDYGAYEGLTTYDIRERTGHADWTVFADGVVPGDTPGELVEEVAARAARVLDAVEKHRHAGDVALVGHGQAMRVLAAVYLRQEPRFGANLVFSAGAISVLGHHYHDPVIELWNRTV